MLEYTYLLHVKRSFDHAKETACFATKEARECKSSKNVVRLFSFPSPPKNGSEVGAFSYAVDKISFVMFNFLFLAYNLVYVLMYSGEA